MATPRSASSAWRRRARASSDGVEVELHLGLRAHDAAGVAALEDDAARGGLRPLERGQLVAHHARAW